MEIGNMLSFYGLIVSTVGLFLAWVEEASLVSVGRERIQGLVGQDVPGALTLDQLHSTPLGPAGPFSFFKVVFLGLFFIFGSVLTFDYATGNLVQFVSVYSMALSLVGLVYLAAKVVTKLFGERLALRTARLGLGIATVLRPLLSFESLIVGNVSNMMANKYPNGTYMSGSHSIQVDSEGDLLDDREVRMIRGVVQLDQTMAREIMVPRVDILAVEIGTPIQLLAQQMVDSGHSRFPVYEESLDHVLGIAYSRDILGHLSASGNSQLNITKDVIRTALFIPESKNLEELLTEFQERRLHIALVVDEYGGVSGLVTIEDLLEEIVGEIMDEFDVGEPTIEQIEEGEYVLDSKVSIDQLNELLGTQIENDGFDTVGGFVFDRLGKIPSIGDLVDYEGTQIKIESTVGRRLKKLRVRIPR